MQKEINKITGQAPGVVFQKKEKAREENLVSYFVSCTMCACRYW